MNINNKIATAFGLTSAIAVVGLIAGVYAYEAGKETSTVKLVVMTPVTPPVTVPVVVTTAETVDATIEYEIVKLAEALYGEAKGHQADWPYIASALFARTADDRWDNDIVNVVLTPRPSGKGCEIDAMCDTVVENLTTDVGKQALAFARTAVTAFHDGTFVPTHRGHSWATPKAAADHAYFESLAVVASSDGHDYFGDQPVRPTMRPDCLTGCNAPAESVRPTKRPEPAKQAFAIFGVLAQL